MPPFYLLLRHMAANADVMSAEELKNKDRKDRIADAMRCLNMTEKQELVAFCNDLLSNGRDSKALAEVFEDGHLHFVWHTPEAPRQYLTVIRDVAEDQLRERGE